MIFSLPFGRLHIIPSKGNTMSTIKFRPHAVVTYYNGSREAVAVDFTPTLSFDLDEDLCRYRLIG